MNCLRIQILSRKLIIINELLFYKSKNIRDDVMHK